MAHASQEHWLPVCATQDIVPDTGVCALIHGRHVAVFRIGDDRFYAIDNVDPRCGASVLARGLVGSLGERVVVASPIYKHHFDLSTGECLEAPEHSVRAHAVRNENGQLMVALH